MNHSRCWAEDSGRGTEGSRGGLAAASVACFPLSSILRSRSLSLSEERFPSRFCRSRIALSFRDEKREEPGGRALLELRQQRLQGLGIQVRLPGAEDGLRQ